MSFSSGLAIGCHTCVLKRYGKGSVRNVLPRLVLTISVHLRRNTDGDSSMSLVSPRSGTWERSSWRALNKYSPILSSGHFKVKLLSICSFCVVEKCHDSSCFSEHRLACDIHSILNRTVRYGLAAIPPSLVWSIFVSGISR